jgi:hypothetical protein
VSYKFLRVWVSISAFITLSFGILTLIFSYFYKEIINSIFNNYLYVPYFKYASIITIIIIGILMIILGFIGILGIRKEKSVLIKIFTILN